MLSLKFVEDNIAPDKFEKLKWTDWTDNLPIVAAKLSDEIKDFARVHGSILNRPENGMSRTYWIFESNLFLLEETKIEKL